jgi:hypothetical protein
MSETNTIILLSIVGVITFLNFLFFLSIDERIKSIFSPKNTNLTIDPTKDLPNKEEKKIISAMGDMMKNSHENYMLLMKENTKLSLEILRLRDLLFSLKEKGKLDDNEFNAIYPRSQKSDNYLIK